MGAFRRKPSMPPACDLLFVYGTLKRGLVNHHQLGGAPCLGEAELAGVQLHDLGPFPMAIAGDGLVRGELYRLEPGMLERLDRFEGAPRLYRRERRSLADGRDVWIYLGQPRQVRHSPLLPAGIWPAAASSPRSAVMRSAPPIPADDISDQSGAAAGRPCARACLGVWLRRALLTALLVGPGLQPVRAELSLAQCQRWQRSSGLERIRLGNAIGAAAYLTKIRPFAETDPQQPQLLYAPSDLQRACAGWR